MEAMTSFDNIIMRRLIFIHTDHHKLLTLHDPKGVSSSISQFKTNKLKRWSIKLSALRYVVEHIKGKDNHWAGILSRWGSSDRTEIKVASCNVKYLILAPISPLLLDDYE